MTATTLRVDWTRCDAHGLCAVLDPARITRDEWGFPVIRDPAVATGAERDARRLVAACPALALHLDRQMTGNRSPIATTTEKP